MSINAQKLTNLRTAAEAAIAAGDVTKIHPLTLLALLDHIEGLCTAAARYNWLRDNGPMPRDGVSQPWAGICREDYNEILGGEELDQLVDEAIAVQPSPISEAGG